MWIIYKHTNRINGKVYIGQTQQIPSFRWKNGQGYLHQGQDSVFARAISKYGWDHFEHEILESNIKTKKQANKREIFWIKYYRSYVGFEDANGYNMTLGGDNNEHLGYAVYQIDPKTMQIVNEYPSTAEASRHLCLNEGNASQIRRCCEGIKRSCKGYYWCYKEQYTPQWQPKDNSLISPVFQMDDNLEIIRRYDSITEAGQDGYSAGSITCCCQRKQRKANGYFWCYVSDFNEHWKPAAASFKRNEKIYCFETDTVYANALVASKATGANRNHILHCCQKLPKYNASRGLHFCYANEKDTFVPQNNRDEEPVVCVNTGVHYKTMAEAAMATGSNPASISGCCRGKIKTANGLTWCYERNYNTHMQVNNIQSKPIVCIETGVKYASGNEAARVLNISRGNLSDALKKHSPANGLHFCYAEERAEWQPRQNVRKRAVICVETNCIYDSLRRAGSSVGTSPSNIWFALKNGGLAGGFHWKYAETLKEVEL